MLDNNSILEAVANDELIFMHVLTDPALAPEMIVNLMTINKFFNQALKSQGYWEGVVKRLFPDSYQIARAQPGLQWFLEYKRLQTNHCSGMHARTRELFLAVQGRDILRLRELKFAFADIDWEGKQNIFHILHVANTRHQPLMDYVFKEVIDNPDSNLNAHKTDQGGRTLLHYAARLNQCDFILAFSKNYPKLFLEISHNIRTKTPLQFAATHGHIEAVRVLANLDEHDFDQMSPFSCAIEGGHVDIMRYLVSEFPKPYAAQLNDKKSLLWAASCAQFEAFEYLSKNRKGGLLDAEVNLGVLLASAIKGGSVLIVNKLIKAMKDSLANWRDARDRTALHIAAQHGRAVICGRLIDAGVDLHAVNSMGDTALHVVTGASLYCVATMQALIARGAKVNAQNQHGHTPLHGVIAKRHYHQDFTTVTDILLEHGADINLRSAMSYQMTREGSFVKQSALSPLHLAMTNLYSSEKIAHLLMRGANIDTVDANGNTPLHDLCDSAMLNQEKLELLFKYGANPGLLNQAGFSPLGVLLNRGIRYSEAKFFHYLFGKSTELTAPTVLLNNKSIMFSYVKLSKRSLYNLLLTMPHVEKLHLYSVKITQLDDDIVLPMNSLLKLKLIGLIDMRMSANHRDALVHELRLAAPNLDVTLCQGIRYHTAPTFFAPSTNHQPEHPLENVEASSPKRQKTRK